MLKSDIKKRNSRDSELFDFGKKYESNIISTEFSDYIKPTKPGLLAGDLHNIINHIKYAHIRLPGASGGIISVNPTEDVKLEINRLTKKINILDDNIKKFTVKTEWHKVSLSTDISDPREYNKKNISLEKMLSDTLKELDYLAKPEIKDGTLSQSLYRTYRNLLSSAMDKIIKLRKTLHDSIREIKE